MSSFKNAAKCNQKTHRERAQPSARQHLGLLEKKKDYKKRAELKVVQQYTKGVKENMGFIANDDFHQKQAAKKALMRKALDKNPDEFYFKMIRTRMEDGEHQCEDSVPKYTDAQLKLMKSQDIRYVNFKRSLELKKIEKLKASLHLTDVAEKPKNQHIVFVDSNREAAEFDAVKHLNTHRDLLSRSHNRLTVDKLKTAAIGRTADDESLAAAAVERKKLYSQLCKRIEREKQLTIVAQKMETRKLLLDKKVKRKKISDETLDAPAIYRQVWRRKR